MKNICVYCSSSNQIHESYIKSAQQLSQLMINFNFNLVFGAGKVGLMGTLAHEYSAQNGFMTGVIPEKLYKMNLAHPDVSELITCQTLRQRKQIMEEKADAFIALPGGFGTLDEIIEIISLKQLNYHNKPIVFLNTNNFYANLIEQFNLFYEHQFAKEDNKKIYYLAQTPEEAIKYIQDYQGEVITKLMD